MKTIVLSFTLKDQPWEKIGRAIRELSQNVGECILLHCHHPGSVFLQKGFEHSIDDFLDQFFPMRISLNNGKTVFRKQLAEMAMKMDAEVYVIGDIKDGVKEEVDLYIEAGLPIHEIPLT